MNIFEMSNLGGSVAFTVSAILFAIAATVLAFIFIVPEKRREKLNAFGKFLHDTCNFKYLVVEKLLQALYIFATSLVILNGFFMLVSSAVRPLARRIWADCYDHRADRATAGI